MGEDARERVADIENDLLRRYEDYSPSPGTPWYDIKWLIAELRKAWNELESVGG